MKLQKTLFIGNGLNRCLTGGISWDDLLDKIAKTYHVKHESSIVMPLEFERIINEYLKKTNLKPTRNDESNIYYRTKTQISSYMQIKKPLGSCVHKDIPFKLINNIITSNYDMVLEQAYVESYGGQFSLPNISPKQNKTKYLLQPTMYDEKLTFFHPHGIITQPSSICLGYEHYMGMVETIRNKSNRKIKKDSKGNTLNPPEMVIGRILKGIDTCTNESWEKFYTSDMAILGFGLPECESDIWWLLTHRAYLYYTNHDSIGEHINNHIIYYDIIDNSGLPKSDEVIESKHNGFVYINPHIHFNNKHKLLEGMHVEVRLRVRVYGQTYEDVYRSILKELSSADSWNTIE